MRRLLLLLIVVLVAGCQTGEPTVDYRDVVAVDLVLATMTDDQPSPPSPDPPSPFDCPRCEDTGWITHGDGHRTACPDCRDGSCGPVGGPLDTLRDAKALIRKGNALADRGKTILDRAERDGKISVDIRLPKPAAGDETCGRRTVCPVTDQAERIGSPRIVTPATVRVITPQPDRPNSCDSSSGNSCDSSSGGSSYRRLRIFRRQRR